MPRLVSIQRVASTIVTGRSIPRHKMHELREYERIKIQDIIQAHEYFCMNNNLI